LTILQRDCGRIGELMLRIREEQMTALEQAQLQRFIGDAAEFIAQVWPTEHQTMGEEKVREFVADSVRLCSTHGVESEDLVLSLINVVLALDLDPKEFVSQAWVEQVLKNDELDEDDKIEELERRTDELLLSNESE